MDSEKVLPFTKNYILKGDLKMEFPEVKASNMYGFRFYSETNQWIDFVVLVPRKENSVAYITLRHAIEAYWNFEYECYGDAVEAELDKRKIPYVIIYHDSNDISDDYENRWNAMIEDLVIMEERV